MKTNFVTLAGLAFALAFAPVSQVRAQASVYEGFTYTGSQSITSVTSTATGIGNWTSTTGGIVGTTDSTGLTFGSLVTSGGALDITKPTGGGWQFLAAPITTGTIANGQTLYSSFLFQFTGPNGGDGAGDNFGIGVGNDTGANHTMSLLPKAYNSSPNAGRINFGDNQGSQFVTGNIFDGNTYLFIGKWTNLGGGGSSATAWVISLANFNAIVSGGSVTEAALNANNMATATTAATFTNGSFSTSQFIKMGDFMDGLVNYKVDELRFASNVADIAPIPEPSTYALMGLGSLGLLFLRRKRA